MTRDATFGGDAIRRQFSELAGLLENELTVYLIGGGALTLDDLKNATKDIDLIVRERTELKRLWRVLTAAGYEPQEELSEGYDELGAAFILQKDLRRFDVFHEQVADVIRLTQPMVERSRHLFDEKHLTVKAVSLNDIFLFKAVANREDDVDDMIRIAQTGIDEAVIVEEIHTQLELLGSDEFIGAMKHKLDRLREQGYVFDIHEEINVLHDRTQDGQAVKNAITSLLEHEYDDGLYEGVPESAIQRRVSDETASSGIDWLEQIDALERASDGSFVLTE
jgi:predicted nucleotidyltransferase